VIYNIGLLGRLALLLSLIYFYVGKKFPIKSITYYLGEMMLKYSHRCPVGNCCKQLPSAATYTAATAHTAKPSLLEGSRAHRAPVRPQRL